VTIITGMIWLFGFRLLTLAGIAITVLGIFDASLLDGRDGTHQKRQGARAPAHLHNRTPCEW
jgi:hypothetical protein